MNLMMIIGFKIRNLSKYIMVKNAMKIELNMLQELNMLHRCLLNSALSWSYRIEVGSTFLIKKSISYGPLLYQLVRLDDLGKLSCIFPAE